MTPSTLTQTLLGSLLVKPGDELLQYDNDSLYLIETWVKQFGRLPSHHPQYSQVSLKMGTALSSTGDLEQAERFFMQAIEKSSRSSFASRNLSVK